MLLYIGDNTMTYFINIIIALAISAAVTGILAYLLSLKYETALAGGGKAQSRENPAEDRQDKAKETAGMAVAAGGKMSGNSGETQLSAPINGEVIPLEEIGDGVFSAGVLGQGCGIRPKEGRVWAPFDGTVILVADTKHAIGLKAGRNTPQ